jgi:hypothetical protein
MKVGFNREICLDNKSKEAMKLDIYVNYPGNCEEAFRFYEQHLGGKITSMTTHEHQQNPNMPDGV